MVHTRLEPSASLRTGCVDMGDQCGMTPGRAWVPNLARPFVACWVLGAVVTLPLLTARNT